MSALSCDMREEATALRREGSPDTAALLEQAADELERLEHKAADDEARFAFLQAESYDLRSFSVPTGGDDYDIGWRVVGHWQAPPQERTIAEVCEDDPRAAIDAARALSEGELRAISHPRSAAQ